MNPAFAYELLGNVPYVILLAFCLLIARRGADMAEQNLLKATAHVLGGLGAGALVLVLMYN